MISAVATILGCLALVVMIATVVRVAMVKLWDSARVNPDYVKSVYEEDLGQRWSGSAKPQPELLARNTGNQVPVPNTTFTGKPPSEDLHAKAPAPSAPRSLALGLVPTADLRPAASAAAPPSIIQNIEAKRAAIEFTIRSFFAASDVEHKLAFARDPQRVRPLMENYYQSHLETRMEWKSLGWVLPVEEPGYRLGYAQAIFTNAEPVSLIVEELDDGAFRIDWESSVRYGELDWEEFIKTQPASPKLFRVIASKPRSFPSDAPQGQTLLEIKHPDDDEVIYASFDRGDPKFQPLLQQLQTGNWKDVPLTLRLCYPGASGGGKTARIADVEGKGWLILHGTRS